MALAKVGDFSCHIANILAKHWQKNSLKHLESINADRVYVVDGSEGIGKSTWTFQQMAFLEPSVFKTPESFVSRVAFTPDQFLDLVRNVRNGVVIFDEAFRGLASRAAQSKINKKLIQALMEMRQRNNIVFIVLPSFFMLDIYPAMLRSSGLFNLYFSGDKKRRVWQGYNKADKNSIYQVGIKRGWTYFKKSVFKGYFHAKFPADTKESGHKFQDAYEKKKDEAFREEEVRTVDWRDDRIKKLMGQRDAVVRFIYKKHGISRRKLWQELKFEEDVDFTGRIIQQAVEKPRAVPQTA